MADAVKYLPLIAWRTIANNVVLLTKETETDPATYRLTVSPVDTNDIGQPQKAVGFYFTDYYGIPYKIIAVDTDTIDVSDDFRTKHCPVSGHCGIVHKSAYKGQSLYLPAESFRHLHPLAASNNNKYALSVLFQGEPNAHRITFTNTATPSITNYQGTQGDGRKLAEDYGENPQFDLYTMDSANVFWSRQEVPVLNLVDGLIDSVVWDLSDLYTGYILIRN